MNAISTKRHYRKILSFQKFYPHDVYLDSLMIFIHMFFITTSFIPLKRSMWRKCCIPIGGNAFIIQNFVSLMWIMRSNTTLIHLHCMRNMHVIIFLISGGYFLSVKNLQMAKFAIGLVNDTHVSLPIFGMPHAGITTSE